MKHFQIVNTGIQMKMLAKRAVLAFVHIRVVHLLPVQPDGGARVTLLQSGTCPLVL